MKMVCLRVANLDPCSRMMLLFPVTTGLSHWCAYLAPNFSRLLKWVEVLPS
ncbi:hypothetical protein PM082_004531 [Marasmius tenuissimus]|nr:hypothetical protein PM082_004531 [Marasmius tenuissimus]